MKKMNTIITIALMTILESSSVSLAQTVIVEIENVFTMSEDASNHIAGFYKLLRDYDLNKDTQNGYAITKAEYDMLLIAWEALPPHVRIKIQNEPFKNYYYWHNSFVTNLIVDLCSSSTWKAHLEKMAPLKAQGLSLTLTRLNTPVTLKAARELLVDLLHQGASMVNDGRLEIPKEIKIQAEKRVGGMAWQRLEDWEYLINDYQSSSEAEKLAAVNWFFNQNITAQHDGKGSDYWQSPIETLARGLGDCEDFAIAKYVSLRLLGFSLEQLRIAVVELPNSKGIGHAVVFFYPLNENDPWVLDNEISPNGFIDNHFQRLSKRIKLHKMRPIVGINENFLAPFHEGQNNKLVNHLLARFITVLINTQRLLPRSSVQVKLGFTNPHQYGACSTSSWD